MTTIQATSFKFVNSGSTIFTVTKPGGTTGNIHPNHYVTYKPKGVYSANVNVTQLFSVDFQNGDLLIKKSAGTLPAATAAQITTYLS